ncbi:SecDF P1 head subdomain-containing protein [Streptomyces sparsus]
MTNILNSARRRLMIGAALLALTATACGNGGQDDAGPSPDGAKASGGPLAKELTFHQVAAVAETRCPEEQPLDGKVNVGVAEGDGCLTLDEPALTVTRTRSVGTADGTRSGIGWTVQISLTESDAAKFADLTGRLSRNKTPGDRVAVLLGGDRLLMAPQVSETIKNGELQFTGYQDRKQAEALATDLGARSS